MTEETHNAARSGPRGIVMSIVVSVVAGWVLLIGVTFAIQNYDTRDGTGDAACRRRRSSSTRSGDTGGKLLLLIVIGAQLFCGMSSVTANSRMIYAFSRDGALPGSRLLAPDQPADPDADQRDLAGRRRRVHPGPAVPVERHRLRGRHLDRGDRPVHRLRACRPSCGCGRATSFERGPWHLGRWSRPDRHGSPWSGSSSSRSCSCCRTVEPDHAAATSTTRRSPCSSCSASPASSGWSRRGTGSPARRCRARPEELAAIEAGARRLMPCRDRQAARPADRGGAPVRRRVRARSTPSCSPSPTCRAACRASGCRPSTSWTRWPSTPPRAATTCSPWTST